MTWNDSLSTRIREWRDWQAILIWMAVRARLILLEYVVIADGNSWVLRESRGTLFLIVVAIGGGEFEGVSSRIFSGDLACIPGRWIPRTEYGSHCG